MFTYENGVFVAFLIWAYIAIFLIISINSTLENNLNKVGQRISWLTLTPKTMDSDDKSTRLRSVLKYLLITGLGLPFILLSWLYVVWCVGCVFYSKVKDSGAPQIIKEYRWKMRNIEMSFDQIIKEMMKVAGEDLDNFDSYRSNWINDMQDRGLPTPAIISREDY